MDVSLVPFLCARSAMPLATIGTQERNERTVSTERCSHQLCRVVRVFECTQMNVSGAWGVAPLFGFVFSESAKNNGFPRTVTLFFYDIRKIRPVFNLERPYVTY